ncbi:MAG: transporter substrate-binding domain-containing protein [Maribacter sp.]
MFKIRITILHEFLFFGVLFALVSGCKTKLAESVSNSRTVSTPYSPILESIKDTKTIKVGTTGDFMPFSYTVDSIIGYGGIDIEMAQDLAKSLGVQVKFVETSWQTLLSDLKAGKFDIGMSGITITEARQQQAFFSIPVYSSGKAAITRDENASAYNSIEAINSKNVRVIFNPGGTNESFARANFPKATLIENEDNLSIFQKLVDGEADVMVTDAVETLMQEQIHPELEAVNPQKTFNSFDFGYLIEKDSIFKNTLLTTGSYPEKRIAWFSNY